MRCLNGARKLLRTWQRKLIAGRAEVERLEDELAAPVPAPEPRGRRTLREQAGTFPAGSRVTVEPGHLSGYGARIQRPDGSGTATHRDTEIEALAWVEAQLALPVLH